MLFHHRIAIACWNYYLRVFMYFCCDKVYEYKSDIWCVVIVKIERER